MLEYWIKKLSGCNFNKLLPTDFHISGKYKEQSYQRSIDGELFDLLNKATREQDISLYVFMLTSLKILVYKVTGEKDIALIAPSFYRVNNVNNWVILRDVINESSSFKEFLYSVKETVSEAYVNQDYPIENLLEMFSLDGYAGLLNIVLYMESIHNVFGRKDYKDVDIKIMISKETDKIDLNISFNTNVYEKSTVEILIEHFVNILKAVSEDTKVKLSEIDMLTEGEKYKLLYEFNNTYVKYPRDKTIHELFEQQVEKTPDSIAIVFEDNKLTYRELNNKSNRLARKLREMGVKADSIVGIIVERSFEMIIGIIGVLKAGGAYLPIDPEYPEDRIGYMLQNSGANILLVQRKLIEKVNFNGNIMDLEDEKIYMQAEENLENINTSNNLAYLIYTSGSTGMPKGVMIEHKSIINTLLWRIKYYKFSSEDVVLQIPSFSFDSSVEDIFTSLLSGAKLILILQDSKLDLQYIKTCIKKNNVKYMILVPSLYKVMLKEIGDSLVNMKGITIAGENFARELVTEHYKKLNNVQLYNEYGPTENSVCTSVYKINKDNINMLIGKPINNTKCYVLSKNNKLQPIGILGQICIAGEGLARGYLNNVELTAEKFIESPFVFGERMYKTGDLARWMQDGNIEFCGRIDHQVKIRGYRIELGEIESQLLNYEEIKESIVIDRKDENGVKYLCAYLVSEKELTVGELRKYLSKNLPDYMIPSYFVQLDKMPLTQNGKIDRKALAELDGNIIIGEKYEAAINDVEKRLCVIVSEVLKVDNISINDNLFDLGADSLKLIIILPKIQKEFDVKISIGDLFSNATIKKIYKKIISLDKNRYSTISKVEKREYYPASSVQKRLYVLNQLDIDSTSYNIPITLKIKGALDIIKVQKVFACLMDRHEILRTTFKIENNNIVQKINDKIEFLVEYDEVNNSNFEFEDFQKNFIRSFNLENDSLIRVKITKVCVDEFILQIDMHHIISDGHSIEILINEFNNIYLGNELPKVKIQYRDFAVWQNEMIEDGDGNFKEQEEYWLNMYRDSIPKLNMPLDYKKLDIQSFEGDNVAFEIDEELLGKIKKICDETGATMYMVLFASYATLLANYTNDEDMIIGVPVLGRSHSDLENVIGMFVNTLAIRVYPESSKTFREFLYETKNTLLKSYEYQDFELGRLIEVLKLERITSGNPLFDTAFNFITNNQSDIILENMNIEFMESNNKISKFDFSLNTFETKENIYFEIEYCTKLFKKETMQKLAEYYIKILESISQNINIRLNEIELERFKNEKFDMGEVEFNF